MVWLKKKKKQEKKRSDRYKAQLTWITLEKEISFPESTFRFAAISQGLVS